VLNIPAIEHRDEMDQLAGLVNRTTVSAGSEFLPWTSNQSCHQSRLIFVLLLGSS
jgi:hypothetical protein